MSRRSRTPAWSAVAALAVLLFNYPLLALFDVDVRVLGVPLLWAYLFTAWARRHRASSRGSSRDACRCSATWVVVGASVAYLGLLFVVAYYGDRRADRGRSIISNGYVYALSLAVYATSWTFYGSVGRAASTGLGSCRSISGRPSWPRCGGWCSARSCGSRRRNRITSLADFVSSRYGKSSFLGGLVTVIAVVGIVPYIALQLKAISTTFTHPAQADPS